VTVTEPEQNKQLIRFLTDEGLNKGDFALLEDYVDPEYEVHVPGQSGLPRGPAAIKEVLGMWHEAFPDWHLKIEDIVAEGDRVALRFTTTGTHTGELFGIPPTGRRMEVRSQNLHRFRDGKLVESWVVDDVPLSLIQLGVIDVPMPQGPEG
jgi:predicted ester cyclase